MDNFFFLSGINLTKNFKLNSFFKNDFFNFKIHDYFFINSIFNRTVNNYYSSDYFVKNSKVMSISAMKVNNTIFSKNIIKN